MRAKNTILSASTVFLFLLLLAGCSSDVGDKHDHTSGNSPSGSSPSGVPDDQASLEYLIENAPSRDQMLVVRECATSRTGFEFSELPADFGSQDAFSTPPAGSQKIPDEVSSATVDCIFELGLEGRFFPPWDHDKLRERNVED